VTEKEWVRVDEVGRDLGRKAEIALCKMKLIEGTSKGEDKMDVQMEEGRERKIYALIVKFKLGVDVENENLKGEVLRCYVRKYSYATKVGIRKWW